MTDTVRNEFTIRILWVVAGTELLIWAIGTWTTSVYGGHVRIRSTAIAPECWPPRDLPENMGSFPGWEARLRNKTKDLAHDAKFILAVHEELSRR